MKQHLTLAALGPGILVAATGVGAGDLITASLAGSEVGMIVAAAALVGAVLKWTLNEGIARWQMATETTVLEGWVRYLHPIVQWTFLVYFLFWSFVVGGALVNACGVAGMSLVPIGSASESKIFWGVVHSLAAVLIVRRGGFRWFEGAMAASVAVMVAGVVVTAALLLISTVPVTIAATAPSVSRSDLSRWAREDGALELYDLEKDPSENDDLAKKEPEITKRLHGKLVEWRKEVGAKTPQVNPKFDPNRPVNENREGRLRSR